MDLGIFIKADEATARDLAIRFGLTVTVASDGDAKIAFADGARGEIYRHDFVNDRDLEFESYPTVLYFRRCDSWAEQVKALFGQIAEAGIAAMLVKGLETKIDERQAIAAA